MDNDLPSSPLPKNAYRPKTVDVETHASDTSSSHEDSAPLTMMFDLNFEMSISSPPGRRLLTSRREVSFTTRKGAQSAKVILSSTWSSPEMIAPSEVVQQDVDQRY
ncbi:hypothetical protein KCU85_g438, partial [Aureobasidium melanogenum]